MFAVRVQKTEVAGASEAFGQYVLENHPEECCAGHGSCLEAFGFRVLVAKGDSAVSQARMSFF